MLSEFFLSVSLVGSEWVLYLLVILSILSVALILERYAFFKKANQDAVDFRTNIRNAIANGDYELAHRIARERSDNPNTKGASFEANLTVALLDFRQAAKQAHSAEKFSQVAHDVLTRTRVRWEKYLVVLATIGSNAPFIGLFGTVLGIIQAFHDLSQQATAGAASSVTAGLSEALVATGVGILVAIPAVVAFNFFQRWVKGSLSEAEALQSFLISRLSTDKGSE